MDKVVAVVVTYNRQDWLKKCIDAILAQSYTVSKLLIINNKSTDGTDKLFVEGGKYYGNEVVQCLNLDENIGGAGGFSTGIKYTNENLDYDWIWVMDDDVIPEKDSLRELLDAKGCLSMSDEKIGFLASEVYGLQGQPMNVPEVDTRPTNNGYPEWFEYLENGLILIRSATFVSILVPKAAVQAVGYPISDYFIWGDDIEYTTRITQNYGLAYLVGRSKVLHARQTGKAVSIMNADTPQRIRMYHYLYRNSLLNTKKYESNKRVIKQLLYAERISLNVLIRAKNYKWLRFITVQRGIFEFLFKSKAL